LAAVAVSEAFRIAEGFGVDLKVVTDVISKSSGHTWLMEQMHPVPGIVARAASSNGYAPGFMTDLMCKDVGWPWTPRALCGSRSSWRPRPAGLPARLLSRPRAQGLHERFHFLKPSSDQAPV